MSNALDSTTGASRDTFTTLGDILTTLGDNLTTLRDILTTLRDTSAHVAKVDLRHIVCNFLTAGIRVGVAESEFVSPRRESFAYRMWGTFFTCHSREWHVKNVPHIIGNSEKSLPISDVEILPLHRAPLGFCGIEDPRRGRREYENFVSSVVRQVETDGIDSHAGAIGANVGHAARVPSSRMARGHLLSGNPKVNYSARELIIQHASRVLYIRRAPRQRFRWGSPTGSIPLPEFTR